MPTYLPTTFCGPKILRVLRCQKELVGSPPSNVFWNGLPILIRNMFLISLEPANSTEPIKRTPSPNPRTVTGIWKAWLPQFVILRACFRTWGHRGRPCVRDGGHVGSRFGFQRVGDVSGHRLQIILRPQSKYSVVCFGLISQIESNPSRRIRTPKKMLQKTVQNHGNELGPTAMQTQQL